MSFSSSRYKIGDLVSFDFIRSLGIILEERVAEHLEPEEEIYEYLVKWSTGEQFWCLEFTLRTFFAENH